MTEPAAAQNIGPVADRLLTVKQVAGRLGLSERKTWELIRRGDIPHKRIDRSVRVPESVLDEYITGDLKRGADQEGER